ncbi:MAG: succinate dehydrogenase, cytochrome b556 subunit [Gammaproteobacteria bacterium]
MAADHRPLSPHLQIYRPQLTSVLSILHRATGVFLALGMLALVYWLSALSQGPESYLAAISFLGSVPGKLLLLGWALSFFFHLLNGIRHLFWDAGKGFELSQVYSSGWMVVFGAVILTAITWFAISGGAS